jgi:PKD repeat protein
MTQKLSWTVLTVSLGLLLTACPSSTPPPAADTTAPSVSLTASPSSVTVAGNVTLSATATDAVGVTKVMFFAGSTQIGEDTSAPYTWSDPITRAQNGERSYSAKALDAAGNEGRSSAQNVTVNIPAPIENRAPLADFTASSSGLVLNVTNSSSDPDGDPLTYTWNWGDSSPDSSGANPSHTYASSGTYNVKLTASDGRGGNSVKTLSVTVTAGVPGNRAPVANFTLAVSSLTITPTNTSSDPDGDPLTYSWNWGDASPLSSGANPAHTYAAAGTYTVTLTANDGRGGSNSSTRSVTVSSAASTGGVWDASSWDGANFQ